jgi:S1-C subfamily serine protease
MSINPETGRGIVLRLASNAPSLRTERVAGGYYKVRLTQGGDELFNHENSQLILQYLGEFLPRAVERTAEDGSPELLYQFLLNGKDICGGSSQLRDGNELPADEIDRLNNAIAAMKAKEADPETDPTKRKAISGFRLPSPQKDPELYRVCNVRGKKRLLVLWGVEKEPGSSVIPQDAVSTVVTGITGGGIRGDKNSKRIPAFAWLLIPLCLALAVYGAYSKWGPGKNGEMANTSAIVDTSNSPKSTNSEPIGDPETEKSIATLDSNTDVPVIAVDPATGAPIPTVDPPTKSSTTANGAEIAMPDAAGDDLSEVPSSRNEINAGSLSTEASDDLSALMVISGPSELPISETVTLAQPRTAAPNEIDTAKLVRPAVVTIAAGTKESGFTGQGTGFIISSNGLVVTSAHVIQGMDQLVAITADGRTLRIAKVLKADNSRDLALLTVESQNAELPFLKLGEANSAVVGGGIAVMGTPQGLSSTFTTGIVSAIREEDTVDLVQITAPVSPGSSGSPVVDDEALVVGIVRGGVDMKIAQALNFAIDVGELHELLEELRSKGAVESTEILGRITEGEATNTKDVETLPLESATAKAPEYPVVWKPEQILPVAESAAMPNLSQPSQTEDPVLPQPPKKIEAVAGRIQVTEVSRRLITDQEMEIQLQVVLRNKDSTLEPVASLRCESAGKELKVIGDKFFLIAGKGTNKIRVSGMDSDGTPVMADLDINVIFEVTSDVEIKVK